MALRVRDASQRLKSAWFFAAWFCLVASASPLSARGVSAPLGTSLEARAAMFVIDRFLDEKNDLDDIAAFYGESVFYFREGVQSRAEVLADKKAYLQRWPNRRFFPDLTTLRTRLIEGPDGRRDVEVRLEVDFEVAGKRRDLRRRNRLEDTEDDARTRAYRTGRGQRVSRGRSVVIIILAEREDDFIVLSEGGQVVQRR